jgi:hypothetical protein
MRVIQDWRAQSRETQAAINRRLLPFCSYQMGMSVAALAAVGGPPGSRVVRSLRVALGRARHRGAL